MESKTPTSNKRKKSKKKGVTVPPIAFYKTNTKKQSENRSIKFKKKNHLIDDDSENDENNKYLLTEINIRSLNLKGNEIRKFEKIYSPRTTFILQQEKEELLLYDLAKAFDPITIKIMKSFFKERIGEITKNEFIGLLQNNLLTWHTELPNREFIMNKLLAKIFEDIDIDNNKKISWDELMDFVMNASYSIGNKKNYETKSFIPLKIIIDDSEYTDIVSHAFYIEKYNLIGIVIEGKSYILFYDGENCKKQKAFIDLKETQQKIDEMKFNELAEKAKEKLEKKEEIKLFKLQNNLNLQKMKRNNKSIDLEKNMLKNKKFNLDFKNITKRNETPEKEKKELKEIKTLTTDYFKTNKKDFNKKLTILCTVFVNEYDVLFVSSSNNKISAWKYQENEFQNINMLEGELKYKYNINCAILDAELPQQTLEWDPIQKLLYSGQADGKILMWNINKSKNIENSTLDFEEAKKRHEDDIRKHRIIDVDEIEVKNDKYDEKTIRQYLNKITDRSDKKNFFEKIPEKGKKIKLFGDNAFLSNKMDFCLDYASVSCIKFIEKMQYLAAGYYNGNLILWDTILKEHRKFYTDQNTGIYQLEYDANKNLIYTCGFDHDIFIYDPYVDSRCIHKLRGHNYSINSIACMNSDNGFVSIDIYGNIKIWDLSNYYNYQSINLNETLNIIKFKNNQNQTKKKISSNQKMIYLPKVKKILTFGEKLMMFGMASTKLIDLCDTRLVLGCFYIPLKFNFYTVCLKKIKVWNVFNGKLKYVFSNFFHNPNSEITAFFLEKSMKKIYIGDCFGNIVCLKLSSCKVLKTYESCKSEIVSLCHSQKLDLLISLDINSLIRIYKDKDFNENYLLKEFTLENSLIKCIKLNEDYSRILIGTQKGELKYFDIEHLKFDTAITERKQKPESNKKSDEDPINLIYSFDEYPLCIAFHESANNFFEIIPPTYYKYRSFGTFKNVIIKDGKERRVKITACEHDKKSKALIIGDFFGIVHCYSLKDLIDNIENLNHNESSKEDLQYLENIEIFKLEKLFSFEASKEKINHINYPTINPNIIVITGSDRRVKLFSAKDGTYIDEFKQTSENEKEYPIGLKYYFSDPFVSKIKSETNLKSDIIYRKDIINYKSNKIKQEINIMKKNRSPIYDYVDNITKLNAKERLYLLTKNADIPFNKSTSWKYEPNLEKINYSERRLSIVDTKDKKLFEYNPVDSKSYYPEFIKYMDSEKVKTFSDEVNSKMRKVQLSLAKIELNQNKFNTQEKINQNQRKMNHSYNKGIKIILNRKYANKDFNLSKYTQKKREIREKFDYFKHDFNSRVNDLESMFDSKIFHKYTFLHENKKYEKKYLLTSNNIFDRNKTPNIRLLPNINNINNNKEKIEKIKLKEKNCDEEDNNNNNKLSDK